MTDKPKTITASWCKDDGERSDVYRLLNLVHAMAGRDANSPRPLWSLKATATHDDYVMTMWTNGIVDVIAETKYQHGDRDNPRHTYTMRACVEDGE